MSDINVTLSTPDVITSTLDTAENIVVSIAADNPISVTIDSGVGAMGVGMPTGGTTGQYVTKKSNADYDFEFSSSSSPVTSVNSKIGAVVLNTDDISDVTRTNKWTTQANLTKLSNIPAGANREVQFNDDGTLGSSGEFRYDKAFKSVVIGDSTILPDTKLAIRNDVASYAQVTFQNINAGEDASTDWIATADNGDDENYYIDLGINSSTYDNADYNITGANDGYIVVEGGNLALTTSEDYIKFGVGGTTTLDKIGEVDIDGINLVTGKTFRVNNVAIGSSADFLSLTDTPDAYIGATVLNERRIHEYMLPNLAAADELAVPFLNQNQSPSLGEGVIVPAGSTFYIKATPAQNTNIVWECTVFGRRGTTTDIQHNIKLTATTTANQVLLQYTPAADWTILAIYTDAEAVGQVCGQARIDFDGRQVLGTPVLGMEESTSTMFDYDSYMGIGTGALNIPLWGIELYPGENIDFTPIPWVADQSSWGLTIAGTETTLSTGTAGATSFAF